MRQFPRPWMVALLGCLAMVFGVMFLVVGAVTADNNRLDLPDCTATPDTGCLERVQGEFGTEPGIRRTGGLVTFRAVDGRHVSRAVHEDVSHQDLALWRYGILHGGSLVATETAGGERHWFGPRWTRTPRVLAVTAFGVGVVLCLLAVLMSRRRPTA